MINPLLLVAPLPIFFVSALLIWTTAPAARVWNGGIDSLIWIIDLILAKGAEFVD